MMMHNFKNILIVVDSKTRSQVLLERGAALAQRNQACLTVMDVVTELPRTLSALILSESPEELQQYIIEKRSQELERLITPLRQKEIQVEVKVFSGTPFLEIIREVLRNGYDLVMIMAEGRGGLKESLFGRTTTHLLRKCPCPVWVMKRNQPRYYRRILAAVDPSPPFDEQRNALNKTIMDLATSLAQTEQGELHIVHTWTIVGETMLKANTDISENEMYQLMQTIKKEHGYWLKELLRQYDLNKLKYQVHLLKGVAGKVIPKLVQAKGVELIVMGTVCRAGVAGLIIGNTAENVLDQVDCSVLTVKPEGFVSPVSLDEK
ncbi:MAG: universal stress protein [Anaerolineae bacterium]|nr:universal stress protein [Anaerolineae bacterium]